jgi:ribosome-binding factor A
MSNYRSHRLAGLVKEEVSRILREDLKDPRLGFVTVTGAQASDDLKSVKVFVSVLGGEREIKENMKILDHASQYVRSQIGHIIQLRHVPDIVFKYDPSIEHGARISKILTDLAVTETATATESEKAKELDKDKESDKDKVGSSDGEIEDSPVKDSPA